MMLDHRVSILVVSYNSESTIIDTLDSVLKQNYPLDRIELIICDDGSNDATFDIAKNWLNKNRSVFLSANIVHSIKNKGVCSNINQGLGVCTTKWIKIIAADDILASNCISSNMSYVSKNPCAKLLCSNIKCFNDGTLSSLIEKKLDESFFELPPLEQYKKLLIENFVPAPSMFISQSVFADIGFMDEEYPMLEDYPFWLKCTSNGYKIYYNPETTVYYRVADSLSQSANRIGSLRYLESYYKFRKDKIWPHWNGFYLSLRFWDEYIEYHQKKIAIHAFNNIKTNGYYAYILITSLFRPIYIFRRLCQNFTYLQNRRRNDS